MIHQFAEDSGNYPDLLRQTPDKPKKLFVKGNVEVLAQPSVAVVGTRNMTSYGKYATQQLVEGLVGSGFAIVSGLALGIDGEAHRTALACGGKTIAVLAHGLDRVFPVEHEGLAGDILSNGGALVSELPEGMGVQKFSFPRRNRIIAGLAMGVLITEAAHKSGAKITARLAAEYGRPVFAVAGPMTSQFSEGTKDLVNLGAKLVTTIEDMLEELPMQISTKRTTKSSSPETFESELEHRLFIEVQKEQGQATINMLAASVQKDINDVQAALLMLEMKGAIQCVGNIYLVP
ncbi:MAG TPA: DNA-processing protein DprA [Candidatus Saccharimonadia bacterium]|nr:DNA-processing protein DprA [Candidatus Saccharimonadia bacterium]